MALCAGYATMPDWQTFYRFLASFDESYRVFHKYIALAFCSFGLIANVGNVIILSSKRSSVNTTLTGIAICDFLVMTSYIIFISGYGFRGNSCTDQFLTYPWSFFGIFHAHMSNILHSCSIWLTVYLALIRLIAVRKRTTSIENVQTLGATAAKCLAILFGVAILNVPTLLIIEIKSSPLGDYCYIDNSTSEVNFYFPDYSSLATNHNCLLLKLSFWLIGLFDKILPSFILVISICHLVRHVLIFQRRRCRLHQNSRLNHTTHLLIIVMIIFVITEVPQGILNLGVAIHGGHFRTMVYNPLGDIIDLLSLANSSINILIYCLMCPGFRQTLNSLCRRGPRSRLEQSNVARIRKRDTLTRPNEYYL